MLRHAFRSFVKSLFNFLVFLQFAAAVVYAALNELVFSPKEYVCYTKTLNKIKDDPRVTVRLGKSCDLYLIGCISFFILNDVP